MLTSEILQRAKQELLTSGWCQGQMENHSTGEVCMMGAILNSVCYGGLEHLNGGYRALDLLAASLTPEEVLAAFDAAIARAQQREAMPLIGTTPWDEAASVPAAVVDAPAAVDARSCEPTHLDGGDRANASLSHYLDE